MHPTERSPTDAQGRRATAQHRDPAGGKWVCASSELSQKARRFGIQTAGKADDFQVKYETRVIPPPIAL
jgi:hypothetical protein